jgi:hypothetical protein
MLTDERVTNVEAALASFIQHSERVIAAIHEDVAEMRASNARTDRQLLEMRQQADRDRQQAEKERQQDRQQADKDRQQAENERQQDRQQADKDRQQAEKARQEDRQQADKDRKDFNKRLAEISDSMGTLIEDMVAPCGFNLAKAIFRTEEAETCAIRIKRKNPLRPGEMMELDLLAVGPTKLLAVEVKRRPDAGKVAEYRDKLKQLPEFFPEFANKTVYPAFASVYIEPSVLAFLNREKIYGIAMGDEVMEVVNLGQF